MVSRGLTTICALALAMSLCATVHAQVTITGGGLTLTLDRATGQPPVGGLTITDGPTGTPVEFEPATDWQVADDEVGYRLREVGGGLAGATVIRATDALLIDLSFANRGDAQRLLTVGWSTPITGKDLTAWDGRGGRKTTSPEYRGGDIHLRLPLSVAFGKDAGVAVGLDPSRLLSQFTNSAQATDGGALVSFSTRLVLDPGQEISLPLCAFAFEPTFGHLDAVQRWYDLYPDAFSMHAGVRDSLIGGGGYLLSRATTRELQWENARRFGMGWEWAYCPAQTPGDWYADERFYDPEKGYMGQTDAHRNGPKGSLDDYRRDLRERFHNGWWATNIAFYMLPHAADEMVLAEFPDGVIINAAGEPDKAMVGWIKPDATTHMTYPWGNSYGREVMREIGQIAADFGPAAIGFDEAYGGLHHYGPGIEGEPARAWDDEGGVYSSTQVALARLGEAIHEQTVRGFTMACVFNKPTSINTASRCDVGMHEHPPYENVDAIVPLRLLLGHKPMSWWSPLKTWELLDWQRIGPDEFRAGMTGMYSYVRLASLRYGAFPMGHQVPAVRQMVDIMPVMTELVREGWQAAPGIEGHPDLWLSRYGEGVRSFLVAGNPKREQRPGALTIHTRYLGPGHFLFSTYEGEPLQTTSSAGRATLHLGALGRHEHAIARALVQIVPDGEATLTGSARTTWEPLAEGTVRASWQMPQATTGAITVRLPRGAKLVAMTLGGELVQAGQSGDVADYRGEIPATGSLRVSYLPPVAVECSAEEILDFPFEEEGRALATIVLPHSPTDHDQYLARFARAYFDYWYRRQTDPVSAVSGLHEIEPTCVLTIAEPGGATTGARLVFATDADHPTVRLDAPDELIISGSTPAQREAALRRLLQVLDAKYPFVGVLNDHPMYVKAGLAGKALD